MTLAELRAKMVEGVDRLLSHPFFVQGEDADILRALKAAILDSDAVVAATAAHLARQHAPPPSRP